MGWMRVPVFCQLVGRCLVQREEQGCGARETCVPVLTALGSQQTACLL